MGTFKAVEASISQMTEYVTGALRTYKINDKLCREYELLTEELVTKLVSCADKGAEISIEVRKRLGKITARFRCRGKSVSLEKEAKDDYSGKIIAEFGESLKQSYSFGVNEIVFSTSSSSNATLLKSIISIILALICGFFLDTFCLEKVVTFIGENIASPIIYYFVSTLQMMAGPVAFFSLACAVVYVRRYFDRNNKAMLLGCKYVFTSIVAIFIGISGWYLINKFIPYIDLTNYKTNGENFIGSSVKDFISQIIPHNIIEPFLLSNPLPMMIFGFILGLAASSLFGKTGDTARHVLSSINDLFARMMNIIYSTIPFFVFFAVLKIYLQSSYIPLSTYALELLFIFISMFSIVLFYILRLAVAGINPFKMIREYSDLLLTNLKIASNIDALPVNKRNLARKTNLSRDFLEEGLNLGILMNMDGNCVVVGFSIMALISFAGVEVSFVQYVGMAIILFLFSVGAPNQPGSFMLGMVLLMSFIGISSDLVSVCIIFEALLSKFYSFLNAAGDIVSLVIEDKRTSVRQNKEKNKAN